MSFTPVIMISEDSACLISSSLFHHVFSNDLSVYFHKPHRPSEVVEWVPLNSAHILALFSVLSDSESFHPALRREIAVLVKDLESYLCNCP